MPALAQMTMQDYPVVKIQALDKSTARTETLTAKVGETIQYGSLFIKAQACREPGPLDKPESAAFLQVWEVPINATKSEWIFSGWMFASSPALSAMDHAVYDVWVLDCLSKEIPDKTQKAKIDKKVIVNQEELEEPEEVSQGEEEVEEVLERAIHDEE